MINGLLGKKQTMTHIFTEEGKVEPVTPIKAGPCIVTVSYTHLTLPTNREV